ncbi:MAG: prepilin-type N-terminal cleavage/methylation domain-containing protein [Armatimonadetes bacterium]|nr:prepilin-type N-terminal cleavage/methylation domain-containing protein [Armatimonadota bacterium]MBS1711548.1 prepilin-type N-terminal cleavage/methylation domain-containing protein [Armatimonadota bacterium]MBX3109897.1 prepilin-type N-terminal cleavage/methylation domain-containing protein [Fimbriimonadaceae bacterium]
MTHPRHRRNKGFTLAEVVVGSVISTIVITAAVTMFIGVAAAWARGEGMIDGDSYTRQAVSIAADELREAIYVNVDADGMGVTYRKPKKDASGNFEVPIVWDGIDRRLFVSGGKLKLNDGTNTRTIAKNVLTKDPFMLHSTVYGSQRYNTSYGEEEAPAYRVFVPNAGGLVSEVTVTVVTGSKGGKPGETVRSRKRERVVLRNVPELIK